MYWKTTTCWPGVTVTATNPGTTMYGVAALPSTRTCQRGSYVALRTTVAVRTALTSPAKYPSAASTSTSELDPGEVVGEAPIGSVGAAAAPPLKATVANCPWLKNVEFR